MKNVIKYVTFILLAFCLISFGTVEASRNYAKLGDKGAKVEEVQAMLTELNLYKSHIDGEFGSKTLSAVKSFQKSVKRAQNGVVDKTLHNLLVRKSGLDFKKFKHSMHVEATGYSAYDPGCSNKTATGASLRRGIIAVDPRVIALGTKVYVSGYGMAVAADTGGAIKGHIIDLAFDSHHEAIQWGRRKVKIFIL